MNPPPLLSITGVRKSYGGTPVLRGAGLELRSGEVHALMGENGAGKSTLIKILAGVVEPDAAGLRLRDEPAEVRSAADALALGLRFLHQELNDVPQLSVAENLFLGRSYPTRFGAFVDWRALRRAAAATLARLGIGHIDPRTPVARLGTGDRMLVRIAGVLVDEAGSEASVYVMDEPTAALNSEESQRLFAVIRELTTRGCGVIYVSHRIDEVLDLADRITVLRDGERVATMDAAATDRRELIRRMTGRDLRDAFPPRSQPPGERVVLEVDGLANDRLHGLDFTVRAGEILGVAGLAGSGQSELLRAVMGADARRGAVRVDGEPAPAGGPAAAWAAGLAFVPEERRTQGLILSRSVRDNATLPHLGRLSHGGALLDRPREDAATRRLGERVALRARGPRQRSWQLSGGNQQKVVFARAIAGEPRVLLLDDPTRGVDVGAKLDLYALIRELSETGAATLLASSELSELLGLCDRIVVLREGRQVAVVEAAGLTQAALLELCYGDRAEPAEARA